MAHIGEGLKVEAFSKYSFEPCFSAAEALLDASYRATQATAALRSPPHSLTLIMQGKLQEYVLVLLKIHKAFFTRFHSFATFSFGINC